MNFLVEFQSEIYISPDLHLMNASAVANQGLPNISGFPPRFLFGVRIIKSAGYSKESKDTEIFSNTSSSLITDLSGNYSNVGV